MLEGGASGIRRLWDELSKGPEGFSTHPALGATRVMILAEHRELDEALCALRELLTLTSAPNPDSSAINQALPGDDKSATVMPKVDGEQEHVQATGQTQLKPVRAQPRRLFERHACVATHALAHTADCSGRHDIADEALKALASAGVKADTALHNFWLRRALSSERGVRSKFVEVGPCLAC